MRGRGHAHTPPLCHGHVPLAPPSDNPGSPPLKILVDKLEIILLTILVILSIHAFGQPTQKIE